MAEHVLTLRSVCAIVQVPHGCSWYPKSIGKRETTHRGVLRRFCSTAMSLLSKVTKDLKDFNVKKEMENTQLARARNWLGRASSTCAQSTRHIS